MDASITWSTTCSFIGLQPELRVIIYTHGLPAGCKYTYRYHNPNGPRRASLAIGPDDTGRYRRKIPSLLSVSKLIREEAVPVFYSTDRIEIRTYRGPGGLRRLTERLRAIKFKSSTLASMSAFALQIAAMPRCACEVDPAHIFVIELNNKHVTLTRDNDNHDLSCLGRYAAQTRKQFDKLYEAFGEALERLDKDIVVVPANDGPERQETDEDSQSEREY